MDKGQTEQPSLSELASQSLQKIQRYAESDDPKESLIAFNVLLFIIIIGLVFSGWLIGGGEIDSLQLFVILAVSLLFASIVGLGYFRLIETVASFSDDKANGLRLAIIVESIILPVALVGLLFQQYLLTQIAFFLLILQTFMPLASQFIQTSTIEVSADSDNGLIWTGLGRTANIITVGSFLTDILIVLVWIFQ